MHYRPVSQMPSRLQTHNAPTWLTQSISLEDYETVCVGHQEVQTKVKARPPPAVLRGERERKKQQHNLIRIIHKNLKHFMGGKFHEMVVSLTHISIFVQFPATP